MSVTPSSLWWGPGAARFNDDSGAYASNSLNDADNKAGMIFFAPKTGNISHVGIHVAAETGTSPAYNVAVVDVDASCLPTTTPAGGSSAAEATFTATGFSWVALPVAAAVTVGTMYGVNVWPNGSPDGSNYIAVAYENAWLDGMARGGYYTTAWTGFASYLGPGIAVKYDDGSIYGLALSDLTPSYQMASNTAVDEMGNKFTLPVNMTIAGVSFYHTPAGVGASFTGTVYIYDENNNVIASSAITDKDQIDDGNLVTVRFAEVTLSGGSVYRVTIKPATTSAIYIARLKFESEAAKNAMPGALNHAKTQRVDAGAWTDAVTDVCPMALYVTGIAFGGGPVAWISG